MMLTGAQMLALLPLLLMAAGITGVMLLIAASRVHRAVAQLTTLGFILTFLACLIPQDAVEVTPLLMMDDYARFVIALISFAGAATTFLLYGYMTGYPGNVEEMYLLLLVAVLGAMILACARHAASLLLGLEIMTIALFGMIAYPVRLKRPLEAGIKYLILSAAASAVMFFGFALLYAATGTLQFEPLHDAIIRTTARGDQTLIWVGAALAWVGFGFKLSLVPFHLWTADVYEGAPAPVTGLLATVSKGAVAALLLRYLDAVQLAQMPSLYATLSIIAAVTILAGNVLALMENNVKRMLAYSSIAHFGYLLVPFLAAGPTANEAVLFYLVAYTIMTLGTFGAVTMMSSPHHDKEADHLYDYRALFWRRPLITAILVPMLLAQAGVPLTVGFLAKFYVLAAGVEQHAWLLATMVVVGSSIGLFYYLRLASVQFLPRPEGQAREGVFSEITITAAFSMLVLFGLLFWIGTFPSTLLRWMAPAVAALG